MSKSNIKNVAETSSTSSQKVWTIQKALNWGFDFLSRTFLETPEMDAKTLLAELLKVSPAQLFLKLQEPLSHERLRTYQGRVKRRSQFEPVAYIVGKKNFMGIDFKVDRRVLIPRPETELLVESAAQTIQKTGFKMPNILEVGTGSGCVAASLAKQFPMSTVTTIDISKDALDVARKNAVQAGVDDQIQFIQNDLFDGFSHEFGDHFDIIISNPPYVPTAEWGSLNPDLFYEPRQALVGGSDGLFFIDRIIHQGFPFIKKNGFLFLEMGIGQSDRVRKIMTDQGFTDISVRKDYSGIDRIISGIKKG